MKHFKRRSLMQIWLWRSLKNDLDLSDEQRNVIDETVWWRMAGHPQGCVLILPTMGFFLAGITGFVLLESKMSGKPTVSSYVILVTFVSLGVIIFLMGMRKLAYQTTRAELKKLGIHLCTRCNYILKDDDASRDRCPECGLAIEK